MRDQWKRVKLTHYTSSRPINAEWSENTPDMMTEFLRFTVGVDEVVMMIGGETLKMKIYEAGAAEIARTSRGLITTLEVREILPKEVVEFDYPFDIAWNDQLSQTHRDTLKVTLPETMPIVILPSSAALIFPMLTSSTIPSTCHENTLFDYHVYKFNGGYADYIETKTRGRLRIGAIVEE